mmetsp:Transcript_16757/g.41224  ORF Transcript_16757/g.41224 Transcript_16757/m.41224 type:complete len:298 (-) Transcript_16757:508-1401(-)
MHKLRGRCRVDDSSQHIIPSHRVLEGIVSAGSLAVANGHQHLHRHARVDALGFVQRHCGWIVCHNGSIGVQLSVDSNFRKEGRRGAGGSQALPDFRLSGTTVAAFHATGIGVVAKDVQLFGVAAHDGADHYNLVGAWICRRVKKETCATFALKHRLEHRGVIVCPGEDHLGHVNWVLGEDSPNEIPVQGLHFLDCLVADSKGARNNSARAGAGDNIKQFVNLGPSNSLQVLEHLKAHHGARSATVQRQYAEPALTRNTRAPLVNSKSSQGSPGRSGGTFGFANFQAAAEILQRLAQL